jgi:hypothetical protein
LRGVINIGCLPASDRKHETFRARFARQGIHINRINAENKIRIIEDRDKPLEDRIEAFKEKERLLDELVGKTDRR